MTESVITLVAVVALIVFALVSAAANAKKRREALEQLAHRHGWQFERDGDRIVDALADYLVFCKGRGRRATNVLMCGDGADTLWAFDYRYTIGSGKHSRTYRHTIVAFPYLEVNLPAFELRPEHMLHKVGEVLGYQDIDFPQFPGFSSSYVLRGRDERTIREMFDGDLADAFDGARPRCVEGGGSCLLLYRARKVVSPDRILDMMNDACDLRDRFVARGQALGWTESRLAEPAGV
jgi:hypothetical protein